ncbi:MAG: metal-dependent hydrolase [Peptostreptococcaceae bacterium]
MRGRTHCTIGVLASIQASLIFKIPISIFSIIISAIFSLLPDLDEANSTISNFFLNKKTSKFIYKLLIYTLNILIFFFSLQINNNFIFSSIITFVSIFIIETKLSHNCLRKIFLSLTFLLLGICLCLIKAKFYIILFTLLLAILPWFKHRGASHSILAIIVLYLLLKQIELLTSIYNLSFWGTISYSSHIFLGDLFTRQGVPLFFPLSEKKFSLGNLRVGGSLSNILEIIIVLFLILLILYSVIKI